MTYRFLGIDHLGVAVSDLDAASKLYGEILGFEISGGEILEDRGLEVRFVGNNDLPLRWWSAALVRHDEWQWRDGRWWIVPGKV